MKRKGLFILGLAAGLSVCTSISAFAGYWVQHDNGEWEYNDCGWKQDSTGWWYKNEDGSYPVSTWQWIDEADRENKGDGVMFCYYFDANGYLVTNTVIDGNTVDGNGAWTVDGVVQTKLEAWKEAQIKREEERKAEEASRSQPRYYYEQANPYLNDPEYQMIREDWFAELNQEISKGKLNPAQEWSLICYAKCERIIFTNAEKEHYYDMERWIAWEIADYMYDNYGWEVDSLNATGSMASNNLFNSDWYPILEIYLKFQGGTDNAQ